MSPEYDAGRRSESTKPHTDRSIDSRVQAGVMHRDGDDDDVGDDGRRAFENRRPIDDRDRRRRAI